MPTSEARAHPSALLVAAGLLGTLSAAAAWLLVGPLVEAVYVGKPLLGLGELLSSFVQRRDTRTADDYVLQVRTLVGPFLVLLAGAGLVPAALRLDRAMTTGRPRRRSDVERPRIAPAKATVAGVTFLALVSVAGWRFALHVAAGVMLLLALRSAAPQHTERPASPPDLLTGPPLLRWEGGAIAGVVVVAAALRLMGVGLLDPYTDEYYHLMAAQERLAGEASDYTRAPLVTALVTLAFSLSGASGFAELVTVARVPFALIGALTVIPIVLLGRRVDRTVGLVAGALWALSPWAIALARTVREYALFPSLTLMFALALMTGVARGASPRRRAVAGLFVVLLLAHLVTDRLSTLALGTIAAVGAAAVATLLTASPRLQRLRSSRARVGRPAVLTGVLLVATAGVLGWRIAGTRTGLTPRPEYLRVFLGGDGAPVHWWGGQGATPLFVLTLLVAGLVIGARSGELVRVLPALTAFAVPLMGLTLLLDRYFTVRYASALLPWFTILVAAAFVWIGRTLRPSAGLTRTGYSSPRYQTAFAMLLLLVVAVRPGDAVTAVTWATHGENPATGETHDPLRGLLEEHGDALSEAVAVVTVEHLARALHIVGLRPFTEPHLYRYTDPDRLASAAASMRASGSGLMLIDERRNGGWSEGFPRSDFVVPGSPQVDVEMLVDYGLMQLYRWSTAETTGSGAPR